MPDASQNAAALPPRSQSHQPGMAGAPVNLDEQHQQRPPLASEALAGLVGISPAWPAEGATGYDRRVTEIAYRDVSAGCAGRSADRGETPAVRGTDAWRGAAGSKPRAWPLIVLAALLIVASLVAGPMVFGSLASRPAWDHAATAASDDRPGEHPSVPNSHIRF